MKTFKFFTYTFILSVVAFSCTTDLQDNQLQETIETTSESPSAKTVVDVVKSHLKADGSFYNLQNPASAMTYDLGFEFAYPITLSLTNGTKIILNSIEDIAIIAKEITSNNTIYGISFPFSIERDGVKETVLSEIDFGILLNSKDTDNDGTPNYQDTDDDGDGASDEAEDQNHDGDSTNDDADNDGIPNYQDTDSDNDGQLDQDEDNDGDGDVTNDDSDNDGDADYVDTDSDNDGIDDGTDTDDDNDGTDDHYNGNDNDNDDDNNNNNNNNNDDNDDNDDDNDNDDNGN
ncbi:hypothetical protein [Polaribacter gangjinensis]|uniref:Uncharacterized protein n=1 Tax=Polaribacter gangjinensis TaxID=574710 RepID=A0A2S7WFH7_9FLAO|nr:hypothetical protein [Polaribacter gangjinensis]PQJ76041.1 hypothetical protein BTO13_12755 [Polaribacter gangjinensis]